MKDALWDFMSKEWYFFGPLLFMSMTALCLVLWRLLLNNSAKTKMDLFLPAFQAVLAKEGIESARKMCASQGGLIPRKLFVAGLDNAKQGAAAMRRAMANTIELEILPEMNFLLAPILAIAKIATMVGLLLTVVSMIQTFTKIQQATTAPTEGGASGGVGAQAGSIGLALFATAMGLLTAIPLVFSHVLFKDKIHHFELLMKSSGQKLINLVQNLKTNPPPTATPAAAGAAGTAKSAVPAAEAVATARKA
jgi:biopolymer transport protein ExbB